MLTSLAIKNYALIDNLSVKFFDGFSTITGETGAGKSILLGGLALILGKRADLSSLKDNNKKCVRFNVIESLRKDQEWVHCVALVVRSFGVIAVR